MIGTAHTKKAPVKGKSPAGGDTAAAARVQVARRAIGMVAYTHYATDPRCRREATAAAAAGWQVHFYALGRGGRGATRRIDGITLHELPLDRYRGGSSARYMVSYARFLILAKLAVLGGHIRHRFAVVHVNTMPDFMVLTAFWPRVLGARVILDIHDLMPELYMAKFNLPATHWKPALVRRMEVWSARLAHAVLTAEHTKAERLIEHGVPEKKVRVLLNLPDDRLFDPAGDAGVGGGDGGLGGGDAGMRGGDAGMGGRGTPVSADPAAPFRLIYHGTLAYRHGLDRAILALAALKDELPGLELKLIGEGDHLEALRRMTRETGLEGRVTIEDRFRPIEEIIPSLRNAHLAILPTRAEISTDYMLPTKLLEYLALGVPALVTPTLTVRRYFGETHPLYIEDASPEALAGRIREARTRYGEIKAATLETRARFFERYRWSRHQREYLELLDELSPKSSGA